MADLDLDRPEAIAAAPFLLPPTATFGHKSKRASHWIYRTNLASTQDRAAIKFLSVDKGGLLEVRMGGGGAGAQTVFPPSTHVSGEPITWEHTDNKIHEIDGDKLLANARQLAAAAPLAIAYPKAGGRHDAAFVLGGFLARCNLGPSWIKLFIEAVAVASGQPSDKRRDMIRTAADGTKSANKAGFPLLAETFGKEVAKKCADWLGYQGGSDDRACDSEARGNDGLAASLGKEAAVSLNDFRAYMPTHNYVYTPARDMWPAASVNSRIPPVQPVDTLGNPILDEKGKQKTIAPNAWLDQNRPVEQMTWAPGLPMIITNRLVSDGGWIEHPGVACFNLYRPPLLLIGGVATKAGRWLELVNMVYPDEGGHIIPWFAHRVQHPEEKINHALLLGGKPGIGKDTLLEPVKRAVAPWNFAEVSPKQVLGRFNGFLKAVILRVSEARDLGDFDRFQFYDHMKTMLASPPDVLRVDEKNLREHPVFNCCGVVFTTNHRADGIYLPAEDRRHFVVWSNLPEGGGVAPGYWNELWEWYENGGYAHVAAYLKELDISGFDPKAPPPKTSAFWDIVAANQTPEEAELADALDRLGNPNATTVANLIATTTPGEDSIRDWLNDRKNRRVIPHRLEKCDYVPVRNEAAKDGLWKINGKRQAVYAKASVRSLQIAADCDATRVSREVGHAYRTA